MLLPCVEWRHLPVTQQQTLQSIILAKDTAQDGEAVPGHHHPTRLSDVLEEDEHSRTSASQVSRRE